MQHRFFRHSPAHSSHLLRFEIILVSLLAPLLIGLHIYIAFTKRFGSDESQHLHVVWGWTRGLVQYRDIFDNHTPLFQMLCAPFFALIPERPDIVVLMRLPMILITLATLVCIYRLGSALFSRRVGLWASIFAGFYPLLFIKSSEFRTDQPWAFLWIASLTVLLCGRLTRLRAFCFGLLLGATFATSMKTSLLAITAIVGAAVVLFFWQKKRPPVSWKNLSLTAIAILAGTLVIPSLITIYFASKGALHPLYYCVFEHNAIAGLGHSDRFRVRNFYFPIALLFVIFGVSQIIARTENRSLAIRRAFLFASAPLYGYALISYWPLVTMQDYLPNLPLLILLGVALLFMVSEWTYRRWRLPVSLILGVLLAVELFKAIDHLPRRPIDNGNPSNMPSYEKQLATLLALTSPDEYVMDRKGSTIYRKRPFYYVLESVTDYRIERGLIRDTIAQDLVRTQTRVIVDPAHYPQSVRAFAADNYLSAKLNIYVVGKILTSTANRQPQSAQCDIQIAANYVFLDANHHPVSVSLDGKPPAESAFIGIGKHSFIWNGEKMLTLFYQKAWQQNLKPQSEPTR